jgi:hypothetical protein
MKKILDFSSFSSLGGSHQEDLKKRPQIQETEKDLFEYGPDGDDFQYTRFRELKDNEITFDLLGSDYSDHALLKSKKDGKLYFLFFEASDRDSDIMEYVDVPFEIIGRDEEGYTEYEYDWDSAEVDDTAILAYASDLYKNPSNIGRTIEDLGEKNLLEATDEIADEIISSVRGVVSMMEEKPGSFGYRVNTEKIYWKGFLEVLLTQFPHLAESGMNEAEGIHPAIRKHLADFLKENPKATFAEAKNYIADKIKGWKLSEEDFKEAKVLKD